MNATPRDKKTGLKQLYYKEGIITICLIIALAYVLVDTFVPDSAWIMLTHTYQAFFKTTALCFPVYSNLAFTVLFIIPYLLTFIMIFYLIICVTSAILSSGKNKKER